MALATVVWEIFSNALRKEIFSQAEPYTRTHRKKNNLLKALRRIMYSVSNGTSLGRTGDNESLAALLLSAIFLLLIHLEAPVVLEKR